MSLGPASHIVLSQKIDKSILSEWFSWQADVLYYNAGIKIWLSSYPLKSKKGTRHQFFLQNGTSAKHLFLAFVLQAAKLKEVYFLYNDTEGTVEITLPAEFSFLFDRFLEALSQEDTKPFPMFRHLLTNYWRYASINVYY